MTKRLASKHKVDRRLKVNLWGRPKSPFNSRNYPPGQHGKSRRGKPSDYGTQLEAKQKIGIIFGPEASGLSNDELNCADYLVKIPTNKKFNSLNLSHSVILFCFQLFVFFSKKRFIYKSNYKSSKANKSEVNKFLNFIIQSLDERGFLQPGPKRQSMIRNIENIFYRTNLSGQEIRILLGIFATIGDLNRKS